MDGSQRNSSPMDIKIMKTGSSVDKDGKWKEIYQYIFEYISICPIYKENYIDIFDISEKMYRHYFFLNKHTFSHKHFSRQWQFFFYLRKGLNQFSNTRTWKINNYFFTRYFPSTSVCHTNSRFCWKLLRTIIHSLDLEKLIITFFQEKNEKMWICYNPMGKISMIFFKSVPDMGHP